MQSSVTAQGSLPGFVPTTVDCPRNAMEYLIQSCFLLHIQHTRLSPSFLGTLASPILGEVMLLGSPCPAPSLGNVTAAKRGSQLCETHPAETLELLHQSLVLPLLCPCAKGLWLQRIPWDRPRDTAWSPPALSLPHGLKTGHQGSPQMLQGQILGTGCLPTAPLKSDH